MESFEQLARQYEPMIHKLIFTANIYKNKEEFFQLGLISLWEASQRFNPEKGNFTNYAYTYIKGKFMTELTKANKHEERNIYPKEEFWEFIVDPITEDPFEVNFLLSYCEPLTPNQTKWVLYTFLDGLTIKEIAEKENVSVSAVKSWRKGAKEKLRESLKSCR
ncbi:sigma-70 family RNA polymerase sigma factor [Bacillus methanolicus]|uniref:RNA polymerase factor sigma-70 n=1 Tax=Bacillus methanolicus (strain MGA3 / ATCC 53907) TaxID=796606 RepID=I3EB52_BACMM|nr:sigma-70 family RNA polymerase sigma factor [Bacillus methanolicus]AIE61405.1 RNA polymerase factor sigma-70 [Bacillus methanolicus MGA3]EIJ83723.1 RNA polymerase sigma-70factor [Bacillus methanolicus MGA3]UQD53446.1 RNA polymerase subunit sigma-24 [Bacillus methanolicus]